MLARIGQIARDAGWMHETLCSGARTGPPRRFRAWRAICERTATGSTSDSGPVSGGTALQRGRSSNWRE
jgi:hypothetical protein